MIFPRVAWQACRCVDRLNFVRPCSLLTCHPGHQGYQCTWSPSRIQSRHKSCCGLKVTICGAAGCTGQPLALLLKQCPLIDELALYDQCPTCGFGLELSHVDTKCSVASYSGRHMIADALKDARVVVIVARNMCDTFENNAPIITEIALQICNICPSAFTIVATEPVESLVPLVGEIQRLRSVYNPRALLGCVELNCVRANTVLADFLKVPPESVRVPVIGGATPQTMVPVLSAACHPCLMSQEQVECLTSCIMSGTETVCASKGCYKATPCFAGAYAIARVTINVVKALKGDKIVQCAYVDSLGTCAPCCQFFASDVSMKSYAIARATIHLVKALKGDKIVQCAYVDSLGTCAPCCQFFASDVVLGPSGIEKNKGIPELTKFENCLLCSCLPYVRNEIARAVWLVYTMCQQCCCPTCCVHPCTCFRQPVMPCVPPVNWTCDCPDAHRDEYLASICRDMTCTCGSNELCWRPREADYDAARASNLTHQMPLQSPACSMCRVPRSVQITQEIRQRAVDPCKTNA